MSNLQASIVAAVTQIVAVVVSFGVLNNTEAGLIISSATAVVSAAFVIGSAIEGYAKAKVKAAQIAAGK